MKGTLCLFAKPPRPGRVKTRLAAAVGEARAAELAAAFLRDSWSAAARAGFARTVLSTPEPWPDDLALPGRPEIWLQGEGDLGQRMERVLRRALEGGDFAAAIGADTPGLPARLLAQAASALGETDAVLGPAEDGGFYLLALRRCPAGLLEGLPWSEAGTLAATRARLEARGLSVRLLEPWFDVDRAEDLVRLRAAMERGEVDAPETARLLFREGPVPARPRVSVVIPALDEEARIGGQLAALGRLPLHEVVVADGGSRDRTVACVRAFPSVRLVASRRGRAAQLNAGAAAAGGDVLLFLHADVRLPENAVDLVAAALARPGTVAGAFRTWTVAEGRRHLLGPLLHLADLRSRYSRLPYGDQALFVRAEAFRRAGGFPEQPLMEDLELSRRLRRLGRVEIVPASVQVSGRRFLARPAYYTLLVNLFPLLYRLGVPPAWLAPLYGDPR
ncbi:MAG: TIGR04283 family arsenosugar biosynthesis glycosyltransferase [Myxococcales bacterium]